MDASQMYSTAAISTQQRGKLIVMLYDGAIKFLKVAAQKLQEGDFASKGVYIGRAQDIVSELNNCLDMEAGGELSDNLRSLYSYICRQLTAANIERDTGKLEECANLLGELRGAWEQVAKHTESAPAPAEVAAPRGFQA